MSGLKEDILKRLKADQAKPSKTKTKPMDDKTDFLVGIYPKDLPQK